MHREIYLNRPGFGAVLHSQSRAATVLACERNPPENLDFIPEIPAYVRKFAYVEYRPPGSNDLAGMVGGEHAETAEEQRCLPSGEVFWQLRGAQAILDRAEQGAVLHEQRRGGDGLEVLRPVRRVEHVLEVDLHTRSGRIGARSCIPAETAHGAPGAANHPVHPRLGGRFAPTIPSPRGRTRNSPPLSSAHTCPAPVRQPETRPTPCALRGR